MPNELAIWSTALSKSYRGKTALAGLDLSVPAGSVFALLGPNGAGKTTAVRVLSTLARPDGGRASVAGYDIVAQRHEVRRRISLTGQEITLDALQTGRETLEMMGRLGHLSAGQPRRGPASCWSGSTSRMRPTGAWGPTRGACSESWTSPPGCSAGPR